MTTNTATAQALPEIPCAQAHNTWNPGHRAHHWFSKRTYPGQDAHCPGSVLHADKVTCEHYPNGQPAGGCYWCGTYPN